MERDELKTAIVDVFRYFGVKETLNVIAESFKKESEDRFGYTDYREAEGLSYAAAGIAEIAEMFPRNVGDNVIANFVKANKQVDDEDLDITPY